MTAADERLWLECERRLVTVAQKAAAKERTNTQRRTSAREVRVVHQGKGKVIDIEGQRELLEKEHASNDEEDEARHEEAGLADAEPSRKRRYPPIKTTSEAAEDRSFSGRMRRQAASQRRADDHSATLTRILPPRVHGRCQSSFHETGNIPRRSSIRVLHFPVAARSCVALKGFRIFDPSFAMKCW